MLPAVGPAVVRSCGLRGTHFIRRYLASQAASSHSPPIAAPTAAHATTSVSTWQYHSQWCSRGTSIVSRDNNKKVRLLHTLPTAPSDRVVTAQLLEHPEELLQFVSDSSSRDLPTLQQVLRRLARASKDPGVASVLQKDERLHQLLNQIGILLQQADGRMLAQISSSLAVLRVSNLATQQVRDIEVQQFVWREVQQQLQQLQPPDLCLLLEAMRRWGAYSRSNCDLLLQRMSEEIDSFTAADVAASIDAIASMGLARGFLLRQLSSLAFENLHQFSQQQLLVLMKGLGRLRFLTPANCETLLQHFRIDCSSAEEQQQHSPGSDRGAAGDLGWTPHKSAQLLGALALCDVGPLQSGLESMLLQLLQHIEKTFGGPSTPETASAGLQKVDLLQRILEALYAKPVSKDRLILMRVHEIQRAAELELKSCKAQPPLAWRTAFDEAKVSCLLALRYVLFLVFTANLVGVSLLSSSARQMQDRQETSGLHAEVSLALDLLRGPHRLQLQRNVACGGYRVDFFDQDTRICIDVDTDDQLLYLKQRLAPVLQQRDRLQPAQQFA
ncbi:hypothetical protein cyc_01690 [Cyclospora cayetanensis]|uniref:Uncharacterized protein n=1 Tax=Cyclospora cayetanensis TaxID=88456 RepID=A0A1D3CRZ9_9EIME|nr:hypothetical protein cyc_01690 [Cyclospora cayetanensis]